MQLIAVILDNDRHDGHRDQRKQGQLPANLGAHHHQHRQAHYQRIDQRQHPFTGSENDPVDIIGGACHQIAGTVAQIESRVLAAKLAIEIFTQFDGKLIRRAKQQHSPYVAQQVDHHGGAEHQPQPCHQHAAGHLFFGNTVDNDPHQLGWQQLQNGNDDQQHHCPQVAAPLAAEVPADLGK
ncbi:hypothetical protein D3C72_1348070 [compost metagenome]